MKFNIFKKTSKCLKILSCNAALETAVIYGFYKWLSCTEKHKILWEINQHRNWHSHKLSVVSPIKLFHLNLLIWTISLDSVKNNSPKMCFLKAETVRHTCFHYIQIQLSNSVSYKMLLFLQKSLCQHHL